MTRVGILADTHGSLLPRVFSFFEDCDMICHAGDIGNLQTLDLLNQFKPLKVVLGNIDGHEIRLQCKEVEIFNIEKVKVAMIHIGGYPDRYSPQALDIIRRHKPDMFITGHSHILRILNDQKHHLLYINPRAAGKSGFHQVITCIKLEIDGDRTINAQVLELERDKVI